MRLVNNTGATLDSFTVTYNGEQWRDGASTTGETLLFDYSLNATVVDWFSPADSTSVFTSVPALNFTSPVTPSTGGAQVNGNAEGLIPDITATVSGILWVPGGELWLRWADPQLPSLADDGLAIDNFSFVATAPANVPDAKLTFGRSGTGQLQLEWVGAEAYSWQVQHSGDLQAWTAAGPAAPESSGPMTYVISPALLTTGRHYFRLNRAALP